MELEQNPVEQVVFYREPNQLPGFKFSAGIGRSTLFIGILSAL